MLTGKLSCNGRDIELHSVNTLIVGAGAAGLKCAEMLAAYGVKDVAIVVDKQDGE